MLDSLSNDGIESRRETTGCSSQSGSGRESRSVFLTRSEGHVWSRRCVNCRHRALGAVSTLGVGLVRRGGGRKARGFWSRYLVQDGLLLVLADEVGDVVGELG